MCSDLILLLITHYDGKVMFLLCVSVHRGGPSSRYGRGGAPVKVQVKVWGPLDKIRVKILGPPWSSSRSGGPPRSRSGSRSGSRSKGAPPIKVQKCGECGWYASCGHAEGLSCFGEYFYFIGGSYLTVLKCLN